MKATLDIYIDPYMLISNKLTSIIQSELNFTFQVPKNPTTLIKEFTNVKEKFPIVKCLEKERRHPKSSKEKEAPGQLSRIL